MIRLRTLFVAIAVVSAAFSGPASAQHGSISNSALHRVSVAIAPRVRVEVVSRAATGIGLSVQATQSWVLSIKSGKSPRSADGSRLHWSHSPGGEFKAITPVDTVLVAGAGSESPADTAVFLRDTQRGETGSSDAAPVVLTVSTP